MERIVTTVWRRSREGVCDMVREPEKPRGLTTAERIALTTYLALAGALTPAGPSAPNRIGSARWLHSRGSGGDPDRVALCTIPDLSTVRSPIDNAPDTSITFRPRWSFDRAFRRHRLGGASLGPSTA